MGDLGEFNRARQERKLATDLSRPEVGQLLSRLSGQPLLLASRLYGSGLRRVEAARTLGWQYLFPAARLAIDPQSGLLRRHHIDESNINRALRRAAKQA